MACKFDSRNATHTCLITGQPCDHKGNEKDCPQLHKEKSKDDNTYGDFKFAWHRP